MDHLKITHSKDQVENSVKRVKAEIHTPVYKMHKYFARRPHNVFNRLIQTFSNPGDIILDCFCGGGVTLFEGLLNKRKVIAVDLNPLATFVSSCQLLQVSINEYQEIMTEITHNLEQLIDEQYSTICRKCGKSTVVRWYELVHTTTCPNCGKSTILSNEKKVIKNNKPVNGRYTCQNCEHDLSPLDFALGDCELTSVIYKCSCTAGRQKTLPDKHDIDSFKVFNSNFDSLISKYDLWYPTDTIPTNWDRQQEDCLHRKSIQRFCDLFTRRNLFFNSFMLKLIQGYRNHVSSEMYQLLLFTFSAVLRYTNIMTFSAENWMDGRPIAWAKHAYWIPYQFVEVNPMEYIEKRMTAICRGLKFQSSRLGNIQKVKTFDELVSSNGNYIVWTESAARLNIPDESVAAVITDPPYGSNVQYGELSHYWLVWLQNDLHLDKLLFNLTEEVVVNRKSKEKNYADYYTRLKDIFTECYRVLKHDGSLVFTFNNKDIRAWYSMLRAVFDAGFTLEPNGLVYQGPIDEYRNTAHARFAGALHGDFIYTFNKHKICKKKKKPLQIQLIGKDGGIDLASYVRGITEKFLGAKTQCSTSELYVNVISNIAPLLANIADSDRFEGLSHIINMHSFERIWNEHFNYDSSAKLWGLKNTTHDGTSMLAITPPDYSTSFNDKELLSSISHLESSFKVLDGQKLYKNLVNISLHDSRPYHRWARYREGYAGELVKSLIHRSKLQPDTHFIFDPMCGSGSSLVASMETGFDCIGTDVNPYAVDLSNAKIGQYTSEQLRIIESFIAKEPRSSQLSLTSYMNIEDCSPFFKLRNIEQLQGIYYSIMLIHEPVVRQLLFVAWLTILEDCSEKRKDGNGLASRPSIINDVWLRFADQVRLFIEDIRDSPLPKHTVGLALKQSALHSSGAIENFTNRTNKTLGAIIFSPPYANSFDYFESYKLELLCGYYNMKELGKARQDTIRNYRKGYGFDLVSTNKFVRLLSEEIRQRIPEKEQRMRTKDNRSRLVANLLAGYFSDMESVILQLSSSMPVGSYCYIVVDQSSYLGVMIPTDLLLADIARKNGLSVTEIIKCRSATTSGQQLRQYPYLKSILRESIICLEKQ